MCPSARPFVRPNLLPHGTRCLWPLQTTGVCPCQTAGFWHITADLLPIAERLSYDLQHNHRSRAKGGARPQVILDVRGPHRICRRDLRVCMLASMHPLPPSLPPFLPSWSPFRRSFPSSRTHAYMRACMLARTHTCTHPPARPPTHLHPHPPTRIRPPARNHACTHTHLIKHPPSGIHPHGCKPQNAGTRRLMQLATPS